ncbi:alpha/beta hydrolase [Actinorhabdospora filicis]|uniref:Alpha/beta hydrolase n=1 Tax=Actinorhabdospora filicis TaxID=1785913 RepID=A0A9W6SSU9_9ACTN|nr:alpha/beta hydrolase [Actinorhabdospora filicis]GLZ81330.1 alpha/beta hydrolase [Actinorhabdospora filicis]
MLLPTDGATIHYELRGTGPLLFISQSGEGDAGRTVDLVDALEGDFTCLTYDRRGLSRSTLDRPVVTMADHVDDAHRLLAHVAGGPALMLGCSFGAVIGLHLAAGHPGQVETLVAHEPVAPWLLAEADARAHREELAHLQAVYAEGGLAAAFPAIAASLGIDPRDQETEPGVTPQPMDERRRANFGYFIATEFTALREDPGCLDGLATTTTRIVPAAGRTTIPTVYDHVAAHRLAALVGRPLAYFPGGHNGNTTHPRGWAEELWNVLYEG